MPSHFHQQHKEIKVKFLLHHWFGEYVIYELEEDAFPGNFSKITFDKQYFQKFNPSEISLKNVTVAKTLLSKVTQNTVNYYFPVGAKKGDFFISLPTDFLVNKYKATTIFSPTKE